MCDNIRQGADVDEEHKPAEMTPPTRTFRALSAVDVQGARARHLLPLARSPWTVFKMYGFAEISVPTQIALRSSREVLSNEEDGHRQRRGGILLKRAGGLQAGLISACPLNTLEAQNQEYIHAQLQRRIKLWLVGSTTTTTTPKSELEWLLSRRKPIKGIVKSSSISPLHSFFLLCSQF